MKENPKVRHHPSRVTFFHSCKSLEWGEEVIGPSKGSPSCARSSSSKSSYPPSKCAKCPQSPPNPIPRVMSRPSKVTFLLPKASCLACRG